MLTFVPTPIGNLEDISIRALRAITNAEIILCEDTRVSKKLITLLGKKNSINMRDKEYISLHSHNEAQKIDSFKIEMFEKSIIYMSDAGMPCISDPGSLLIRYLQKKEIEYDFIPGANAALVAYGMSGFLENSWSFYGFLPHKDNKRLTELSSIMNSDLNTIIYESPHRIESLLNEIEAIDNNREIFIVKEISKLHQFSIRSTIIEVKNRVKNFKGEWVVIIKSKPKKEKTLNIHEVLNFDIPPKIKAKLLSKMDNRAIKEWYKELTN